MRKTAPLAALPGVCACGMGVLWLRGLRAALADPSVPVLPEVAPFLLASVAAAIAGAWLLAARGRRAWRVPAGLLSLVPLPLGIGAFASMIAPHVLEGPVGFFQKDLGVLCVSPFSEHAVDEDVWSDLPLRYVTLTRDGRVYYRGKAGFASVVRAVEGDPSLLRLHADKEVPWQHVTWVLGALREAGLDRIVLDVRCAHQGAEHGARMPLPLVFSEEDALVVDVVARKEIEAAWYGRRVRVPTEFAYRFRDESTTDLRRLSGLLFGAAAGRGRPLVGRVRAGPRVPLKFVVAAAGALLDIGMGRWVADVEPPPEEVLSTGGDGEALPYPR